jgi:two-component system, LuxR family, sensor kinase FixL
VFRYKIGTGDNNSQFALLSQRDPGLMVAAAEHESDDSLRKFFAGILDVAEDGIVTVDDRHRIVLFNGGAEKLFGWSRGEVLGKSLNQIIPERFAATHDALVEEFGRSPVVARNMGERRGVYGRRKNGEEFPAEITISKMLVDDRLYLTAIVRDISERRQAQEAIEKLNQDLEQRVVERTAELTQSTERLQAKTEELRTTTQQLWQAAKLASVGELAAGIAHELNNPLGTISLRLEALLSKTPADDPRRKAMEIVEQEVERMATLVANLLQFSRRGKEESSTFDVIEELNRTVELMQHQLRRRGVNVQSGFGSQPTVIHADRQKLRQVFLNLVTNAMDAMPSGGTLTLNVHWKTKEAGKPFAIVEVIDTGHGIPPEVLPKVMDPFFTTKDEGKGTGLGLAICRRIVQEHRGSIQIESAAGKGTTVRVVLPGSSEINTKALQDNR